MKTSELKSGYMVCTDEHPVTIHSTLKEAEDHIEYQRKYMNPKKNWYIVEIKLSNWKSFKYNQD